MGRIGCNIGDPSKDFGSEPVRRVEPPPKRAQCSSVYNGKRCDRMLLEDGGAHDGYHVVYDRPTRGMVAWADASSPTEAMRAALDEHADLLYSLGG